MSIRYAQPTNVCIICGIRTRGLPCPTCNVEEQVEETMFKKIWNKIKIYLNLANNNELRRCQDELLRNRFTDSDVSYIGFMWRATCPINH